MDRRVRGAAGVILLLLAIPITLFALYWFVVSLIFVLAAPCLPGAPVCRWPGPGVLVLAAGLVATGLIQGTLGVRILRGLPHAIVGGLLVAIGGLIVTASQATTAFQPVGRTRHETLGMVPVYDSGRILIAAGFGPYLLVLILLLVAFWRSARKMDQPEGSPAR